MTSRNKRDRQKANRQYNLPENEVTALAFGAENATQRVLQGIHKASLELRDSGTSDDAAAALHAVVNWFTADSNDQSLGEYVTSFVRASAGIKEILKEAGLPV